MALTNTQYASIMRIFNDRQLDNHQEEERRRMEIQEKIPEIRFIDNEIASASVRKALAILSDTPDDTDPIRLIDDLSVRKKALLVEHGYPADYLSPVCTCSKCKDTGYIDNVKCSCFREMEASILYNSSNLHKAAADEDFEHFSLQWYGTDTVNDINGRTPRDEAEYAYKTARSFAMNFPQKFSSRQPDNLFLYGSVGTGKTFLSHAIAREVLKAGYSVLYLSAFELFDILGKYAFRSEEEMKQAHDLIFTCDLLLIDDLGTELTNGFTASQLFLIINERLLAGKSTIISTNLSLKRFQDTFSERTTSRILGGYSLVHFSGRDIRLAKKLQREC